MKFINKLFSKNKEKERISQALHKSNQSFLNKLGDLFRDKGIDDCILENLEEALYYANVNSDTVQKLIKKVEKSSKQNVIHDLKIATLEIFNKNESSKSINSEQASKPYFFLIVGINGVGKTTSIAKLANRFKEDNFSVMICAADTFRAAAIDQLVFWSNKIGIPIIKKEQGADPTSVVFNAVESAIAKKIDYVFVDTAGRLHNKTGLMNELDKIKRTILKKIPENQLEILLIIDGTTGQNAINQLREFEKIISVNGLIVTKLDGTSKGGFIISLVDQFQIPIKFICVGEGIHDIVEFNSNNFVDSLFDFKV